MAKRNFVKTYFFLFAAATASANPARADDGCDALGSIVTSSVQAAAKYYGGHPAVGAAVLSYRGGEVGSRATGRLACANTSEVASSAFARALAALGISIAWEGGLLHRPGCPSPDLQRCYLIQDPLAPMLLPGQLARVEAVWDGVRRAIAAQMPFGTENGLSVFTFPSLHAALSSRLDASTAALP
ncbi:MAG: hypothetical protein WD448_11675 [Woeseia sp.]